MRRQQYLSLLIQCNTNDACFTVLLFLPFFPFKNLMTEDLLFCFKNYVFWGGYYANYLLTVTYWENMAYLHRENRLRGGKNH